MEKLFWIMLSVSLCPKVITISGFHFILNFFVSDSPRQPHETDPFNEQLRQTIRYWFSIILNFVQQKKTNFVLYRSENNLCVIKIIIYCSCVHKQIKTCVYSTFLSFLFPEKTTVFQHSNNNFYYSLKRFWFASTKDTII